MAVSIARWVALVQLRLAMVIPVFLGPAGIVSSYVPPRECNSRYGCAVLAFQSAARSAAARPGPTGAVVRVRHPPAPSVSCRLTESLGCRLIGMTCAVILRVRLATLNRLPTIGPIPRSRFNFTPVPPVRRLRNQ